MPAVRRDQGSGWPGTDEWPWPWEPEEEERWGAAIRAKHGEITDLDRRSAARVCVGAWGKGSEVMQ